MQTLLRLLWTDQVGSALSAEMALVTSVTVGALFMGMAEFRATVNREFQNSAAQTGLLTVDDAGDEKKASDEQKKKDAEEKRRKADGVSNDPRTGRKTLRTASISRPATDQRSCFWPDRWRALSWTFAALLTILRPSRADGHFS